MSDSGWSPASYQDHREREIDSVIRAQEAHSQQAAKFGWARLGTSRTQVPIEESPWSLPSFLPPSATLAPQLQPVRPVSSSALRNSNLPVWHHYRPASSAWTSYAATKTTPGPSPSSTTRTSQVTSEAPSKDAWNDSLGQLSSRRAQQGSRYHTETSTSSRSVERASQATFQPTKLFNLQEHATNASSSHELTFYRHDATPPLISDKTRLTELKEDYRDPGSERSEIIRRKINYLRFELGYRGLRRARGDGNCFYRSFAFAYLEHIYFADDRAIAVVSALEYLETAQKLVELAMPRNMFGSQMYFFMQDVIRGMELQIVTHKMLMRMFQNRRDSDNIVAYVRLLASAYIQLTPEMHNLVFHLGDPLTVVSPSEFCSMHVEQLGQDADHIQISAMSRTLNVPVRIYRLDEKIDGIALHKDDVPAHCTRFMPTGHPVIADPVSLLFRPGRYDILERDGPLV